MTDGLSPARRSKNMRAIRNRDTAPEIRVRQIAHRLGYRFRLHRSDLPGKPDLVFVGLRKVVFVHGCFWHQHQECREGRVPASNRGYWRPKLTRNVERDAAHMATLKAGKWKALVLWECEVADDAKTAARLRRFLGPRELSM